MAMACNMFEQIVSCFAIERLASLSLGQWEKAIDDCNAALRERPNYHKALLRRAHSYARGTLSFGDEDGDGICKI